MGQEVEEDMEQDHNLATTLVMLLPTLVLQVLNLNMIDRDPWVLEDRITTSGN